MKNYSASIFALTLVTLMFMGCQKKTNCQANITCNDAQGNPMKGVEVRFFANVKTNTTPPVTRLADVKATGTTDQNGKVTFVFQLPAIFDVSASVGTASTTALIKLQEGQTTEKIVQLN